MLAMKLLAKRRHQRPLLVLVLAILDLVQAMRSTCSLGFQEGCLLAELGSYLPAHPSDL
jgi:hypothetical protein